jgi:hypothetical protein
MMEKYWWGIPIMFIIGVIIIVLYEIYDRREKNEE